VEAGVRVRRLGLGWVGVAVGSLVEGWRDLRPTARDSSHRQGKSSQSKTTLEVVSSDVTADGPGTSPHKRTNKPTLLLSTGYHTLPHMDLRLFPTDGNTEASMMKNKNLPLMDPIRMKKEGEGT